MWSQLLGIGGSGCGLQEEGEWGLGYFQVFMQGDKSFIGVRIRVTVSSLEENKCKVFSVKKWRKILIGHEMCEDLLQEYI